MNFFRSSKGEWSWNKHLEYAIPEDLPKVHPFVTRLTISIGNRKFSAMWKSCVLIELLQMYMCSEDGAGIQHSSGFCENYCEWCENFERFSLAHFTDSMENTNPFWFFTGKRTINCSNFCQICSLIWNFSVVFIVLDWKRNQCVLTVNPLNIVSLTEN